MASSTAAAHHAALPHAGRRERHRTEIRERLFRSALRLFAERGYLETTVEDITEAADVGKGTFFNYFQTTKHVLATFGAERLEAASVDAYEALVGRVGGKLIARRQQDRSLGKLVQAATQARSMGESGKRDAAIGAPHEPACRTLTFDLLPERSRFSLQHFRRPARSRRGSPES